MKTITYSLSLLSLLFFTFSANAQLRVGLNFDYVHALGTFQENIEGNPYGGGFSVSKYLNESNFIFGVDVNSYSYSNNKFEVDLTSRGFENYIGEQREIDLYQTIQLFLRYQFTDSEQYMPYVEGRFGPAAFASLNIIKEDDIDYHNYNLDINGFGVAGGIGTGIMLKPKNFPITFDFGITAGTTSNVRYKGEMTGNENPRPGVFKSNATTVLMRAGFIFNFNGCNCNCEDKGEAVKDIFVPE